MCRSVGRSVREKENELNTHRERERWTSKQIYCNFSKYFTMSDFQWNLAFICEVVDLLLLLLFFLLVCALFVSREKKRVRFLFLILNKCRTFPIVDIPAQNCWLLFHSMVSEIQNYTITPNRKDIALVVFGSTFHSQ